MIRPKHFLSREGLSASGPSDEDVLIPCPPVLTFKQQVMPRLISLLLVVGLYALSFFLPAARGPFFTITRFLGTSWGTLAVVASGRGVFVDMAQRLFAPPHWARLEDDRWPLVFLGFLAHPLLWVGAVLLALGKWRCAAVAGLMALSLGLIWRLDSPRRALGWEDLLVGYYCWLASMAALAAAGLTFQQLSAAPGHAGSAWSAGWRMTLAAVAVTVALGVAAMYLVCRL